MIVKPITTRIFREKEDLVSFIKKHIKNIPENSVLVVTSKIIALSEGRTASLMSEKEKSKLIKRESDYAVRTPWAWLTVRDGVVIASAGIDESNADGKMILFPKDCYRSAREIHQKIRKIYGIKNVGVIVTDSRLLPLRSGVTGMAMGYCGFEGIKSYIGKPDIFGRKFKLSKVNVADGLAASAVIVMGEGKERRPLALITDISDTGIQFAVKPPKKNDLHIAPEQDIYAPFFRDLIKRGKKR